MLEFFSPIRIVTGMIITGFIISPTIENPRATVEAVSGFIDRVTPVIVQFIGAVI